MTDRIRLFKSINYNENSPTKTLKNLERTNIQEREFLREVADAREKIMSSVDHQMDNFVKKSFEQFETTGQLPKIKHNVAGLTNINEAVDVYLIGEKPAVLRETNRKPIFDAPRDLTDRKENEDFPYRTLVRPKFVTPPKGEIYLESTSKEKIPPFQASEKEVPEKFVQEREFDQRILVSERKIKRVPRGKLDKIENTFDESCQRKFVGSFLQGSKKFVFVNLEDEQLNFNGLMLNTESKLPFHSKTIVTNTGDYYLCGGISEGKISPKLFKLNFNNGTLHEVPAMETPRAQHSGKFVKRMNSIIVVGGISELDSKPLKSCEIYDLSSGKWSQGAKMNFGSIEAALIEKGDFVYKVGGKVDEFTASNYIEKFSMKEGTWEIVGYDTIGIDHIFLRLPSISAGFSTGSSLIAFGGVVHKVRSNASYKIEVEKTKPTLEEWKALPLAGPIISPVVSFKGEVYGIQDIGLDLETECQDLAKKKLVIFSDENWESVL